MRNTLSNQSGIILEELPIPKNLQFFECSDDKLHRLLVAIGLSLSEDRIPEGNLSHQTPRIPRPGVREIETNFIDKDQV
jgi:hypothetical protein